MSGQKMRFYSLPPARGLGGGSLGFHLASAAHKVLLVATDSWSIGEENEKR